MFKRIKKWFNDPINEKDYFGVNLKKTYQFFRDLRKKEPETTTPISSTPILNPIPARQTIYDDASYLNVWKMEILSKVVAIEARKNQYYNAVEYISKYYNLVKCIQDIIDLTEQQDRKLELQTQIQECIEKSQQSVSKSILDETIKYHQKIDEIVERNKVVEEETKPSVPPSFDIPPKNDNIKEDDTPSTPSNFNIPPVIEDVYVADHNLVINREVTDSDPNIVEMKSLFAPCCDLRVGPSDNNMIEDHSHDTLTAKVLKFPDLNPDEELDPDGEERV
jgi:hypothetical protein